MQMKRVEVLWYDAFTSDGWEGLDNVVDNHKGPLLCKTVGWLLHEDEESLLICHTFNQQATMGILHIPIGCIKSRKNLR